MAPENPPNPLPGMPVGRTVLRVMALALAGLIIIDRVWWHGALFDHPIWRIARWVITSIGLVVGVLAYAGIVP